MNMAVLDGLLQRGAETAEDAASQATGGEAKPKPVFTARPATYRSSDGGRMVGTLEDWECVEPAVETADGPLVRWWFRPSVQNLPRLCWTTGTIWTPNNNLERVMHFCVQT